MNPIDLFCSFDGRIGRKTYWMATAAIVAAEFFVMVIAGLAIGVWVADFVMLIFFYPQFVVAAKRGHDRNISIWIVGVVFAATLVLDVLDIFFGLALENPYHDPLTFVATIAYAVLGAAMLVELGFRKGTAGPNRYGPDPLAASSPGGG